MEKGLTTGSREGLRAWSAQDASEVLFQQLRRQIDSGELSAGDRLCSVRDLVRDSNLAFETVRQVLARLEALGLLERKRGSGTFVKGTNATQAGRTSASRTVLLLMDTYGHVFRNIADFVVAELQDKGMTCVKYSADRLRPNKLPPSVSEALDDWAKHPPHAVVVNWSRASLYRKLERLHAGGSRIIRLFNSPLMKLEWDFVGSDIDRQAALASEWLVERGHHRIGYVTHQRSITDKDHATRRKALIGDTPMIVALGHAMRGKTGRKGAMTIFYNTADDESGGGDPLSDENIAQAAEWISAPNRPTAVVGSDFRLVGIVKAAAAAGLRIPDDLELLGIGNTPWARAYGFQSIALNERAIAREIAKIVEESRDGMSRATRRVFVAPDMIDTKGETE